jgi:YebC/PmpR family DNA-binding regulatory protein
MAGHSHWKNIKRTKDLDSKKRSLSFARVGKLISLAAKEGGVDINNNPSLKSAVDKAKKINMPKENIEKAIKRGSGEQKENFESFIFECYAPGSTALIIEGITDNINRTLFEVKQIINKFDTKMANPGSVKWLFNKKGLISIKNNNIDEIESIIINSGALDFEIQENKVIIYTNPEELEKIKNNIELNNIEFIHSSLFWQADNEIETTKEDKEKITKLIDNLNENEDIQEIYSNLKK